MSSVQSPGLENMPMEIKIIILSQIPDIGFLSAIVHASPIFHATYLARAEILSSIVLVTLEQRGLEFAQIAHALEIYSHTANQDIYIPIVHDCYQQLASGVRQLTLTVDQSISLLDIAIAVIWVADSDAKSSFRVRFSREGKRALPEPRPAILCRVKIRQDPHRAHITLLRLLVEEGYRISDREIRDSGGIFLGDVMTLEPYEPNTPGS